jgi:NtrC-family two-component system sensor histidine kinase KinB
MLNLAFYGNSLLNCDDIFPGSTVCGQIRKTIETGERPDLPDEQRIIHISGRYYLFSITAIFGKNRNLSGIIVLLRDVTRLREVEKLKSEFVMAASHALRTPLTGLGMSIDLLLEHSPAGLNEKDLDLLQAAHEEVQRMKTLIDDLLDLSKIEAGQIDLAFEHISVKALFDLVVSVFKNQMDIKEVSLILDVPENLPVLRADLNKITWVLTNLVSNALRYVGKGGRIELIARSAGPYVHLSVRDNGPGIPLEYQSRIFQKFVRVKEGEPGGSGLGLAICKEIVRAHGGTIWVESAADKGSTFTFSLPIVK